MKNLSYLLLALLVFTSSCKKDFQFAMKTKHGMIPAEIFTFWLEVVTSDGKVAVQKVIKK